MTPRQIDALVEAVADRYDRLQDYLMGEIARKVKKGLDIGASIQWDAQKYLELGGSWSLGISSEIQKVTGLAEKDVKRLLKGAGLDEIRLENRALPKGHRLPVRYSPQQLRIIRAGIENVNGQLSNFANVTLDSTLELFGDLVSDGYAMLSSGAFSLDEAMNKVGRDLVHRGVSGAIYPSGRHDKVEVAVRRALRTGTNQTMLKLAEHNAEEAGTDLVQVSAHAGARPEHAAWQGKVYSLTGKTKGYQKLSEATGYGTLLGLGGVNCRHTFFPFWPNASEGYSSKELEEFKDEDVMVGGKPMPLYKAEQKMRQFERHLREQKRLALFAGMDTEAKQAAIRRTMRAFSKETGIPLNYGRTKIYGAG